jgi:glucose 1-dehydrogenase
MKAIAVHPGVPNSMHLRDVEMPRVTDVEGGRGVLVEIIRVGVDGTDKEINAAEYGDAPDGHDYLVTGHENFGRVVDVGPNVPSTIRPGGLVVATVRRPGTSIYDVYFERGINKLHGYLTEYYVEDSDFVVPLPDALETVGVLLEPMTVGEKGVNQAYEIQRRLKVWQPRRAAVLGAGTIGLLTALAMRLRGLEVVCYSLERGPYLNSDLIEALGGTYVSSRDKTLKEVGAEHGPFDLMLDATGFSPLVFEAAQVLGKNGVLVLASVTGGDRHTDVPADMLNEGFVLGNKVMVGTVNASRDDFVRSVDGLAKSELLFPGWLSRLLTHPVQGLENHEEMLDHLTNGKGVIKVYVEVAAARGASGRTLAAATAG